MAVRGLRQSQRKYEELAKAVGRLEPDVVAVCGLPSDPDWLRQARRRARTQAERFSYAEMASQTAEVYRKVMESAP